MNSGINSSHTIAAVLVTYFPDQDNLRQVLERLQGQVHVVYIVDNTDCALAATDLMLMLSGSKVHLIQNNVNDGISKAHNVGILAAREGGCSHVLLMDQDSLPAIDMVEQLFQGLNTLISQGLRVAAVGPSTVDARNGRPHFFTRSGNLFVRLVQPQCEDSQPIKSDFLISSGSLIPVAVFDEVGLMEEPLFIDCVDIEWGYRARSQGYELFGIPSTVMEHAIGDDHIELLGRQFTLHSPLRHYYFFRNFYNISLRSYVPLAWKLHVICRSSIQAVIFLCFAPNGLLHLTRILKGIAHGLTGRLGRYG